MWTNRDLTVYHGCDDLSGQAIVNPQLGRPNGIKLSTCSPNSDFGRGFYTTTNLHQAEQWANRRFHTSRAGSAAVVSFTIDRNAIAGLEHMAFVLDGTPPNSDYWELVVHCRRGRDHARSGAASFYDVVYGPVSLFPQYLVIADTDQISFHTTAGLGILSNGAVHSRGSPTY